MVSKRLEITVDDDSTDVKHVRDEVVQRSGVVRGRGEVTIEPMTQFGILLTPSFYTSLLLRRY